MKFAHCIGLALLCVSAAFSQEEGSLLVDRGLPRANWNDASGVAARSNVRWTLYSQGFVGDDFTIGQPGERFVVNTLRIDRKSTRLNSSHTVISYAVFCL